MLPSSPPQGFTVSVEPDHDVVALVPAGELDIASIGVLRQKALELYDDETIRRVVIDLRQVSFMDCAGLRGLLTVQNGAKGTARTVTLLPGPPAVDRIFELTATDRLFEWCDR
jgi:anti-anti-sigma factor